MIGIIKCDKCHKDIDSNNGFYNCLPCEYDECKECGDLARNQGNEGGQEGR